MSLIYSAIYSGVPVYETICRNVSIMRRMSDSYMNATQILKVAGLPKPKRTKILEREVLQGTHEKIQGGYGKYQGTWIPLDAGRELAVRYCVADILAPLLDFDPEKDDLGTRPNQSKSTTGLTARSMRVLSESASANATAAVEHGSPPPSSPGSELIDASFASMGGRAAKSSSAAYRHNGMSSWDDPLEEMSGKIGNRYSKSTRSSVTQSPGSTDNASYGSHSRASSAFGFPSDVFNGDLNSDLNAHDYNYHNEHEPYHYGYPYKNDPSDNVSGDGALYQRRTSRQSRLRGDVASSIDPENTTGNAMHMRGTRSRSRTVSSQGTLTRNTRSSTPVNGIDSQDFYPNNIESDLTDLMPPPPPRRMRKTRSQLAPPEEPIIEDMETVSTHQQRATDPAFSPNLQALGGLQRRSRRRTADTVIMESEILDDRYAERSRHTSAAGLPRRMTRSSTQTYSHASHRNSWESESADGSIQSDDDEYQDMNLDKYSHSFDDADPSATTRNVRTNVEQASDAQSDQIGYVDDLSSPNDRSQFYFRDFIHYKMSPFQLPREVLLRIFSYGDDHVADILEILRDLENRNTLHINLAIDDKQSTALHWAATFACLRVVEALLAHGANPFCRDTHNETPLMRSIAFSANYKSETFPVLLQLLGISIFATDDVGHTALHHAAFLSRMSSKHGLARYYTQCIVAYLECVQGKEAGVPQDALLKLVNMRDNQGRTALHVAACFKCHRVVEILLRSGADASVRDVFGVTPVEAACGDLRMQRLFEGADAHRHVEMLNLDDCSDAPTTPVSRMSPAFFLQALPGASEVSDVSCDAQQPEELLQDATEKEAITSSSILSSLLSMNSSSIMHPASQKTIDAIRVRRELKSATSRLLSARLDIVDVQDIHNLFDSTMQETMQIEARIAELSALTWQQSQVDVNMRPYTPTNTNPHLMLSTSTAEMTSTIPAQLNEHDLCTQSFQVYMQPFPLAFTATSKISSTLVEAAATMAAMHPIIAPAAVEPPSTTHLAQIFSGASTNSEDADELIVREKRSLSDVLGLYELSSKRPRLEDERGSLDLLGDATDIISHEPSEQETSAIQTPPKSPELPQLNSINDDDTRHDSAKNVDDASNQTDQIDLVPLPALDTFSGTTASSSQTSVELHPTDAPLSPSVMLLPELANIPKSTLASEVAAVISRVEAASTTFTTFNVTPTRSHPPSIENQLYTELVDLREQIHKHTTACQDMIAEIHAIDQHRRIKDHRYRSKIAECLEIPLNVLDAALEPLSSLTF